MDTDQSKAHETSHSGGLVAQRQGRWTLGWAGSAALYLASTALVGCDASGGANSSEPSFKDLEARDSADLTHRNDVRVQVAGQLRCRGCTRSQLETLLRVAPRRPFPKDRVDEMWPSKVLRAHAAPDLSRYRWLVKFVDQARVRLSQTGLPQRNQGQQQMPEIEALLSAHGVRMARAIPGPDAELDALAERAMRRSLRAQPDLAGIYQVEGAFANKDAFLAFGRALNQLDIVEYVEIEDLEIPAPGDIPPETPDFSGRQGYLYEKSGGIGAPYAWKLGIFGQGIKVSDCEFSWDTKHEEFSDNPLSVEKGQTLTRPYMDHGTAVMGVTSASHEGFGVKGIAPKATPWVFPETSKENRSRRLAAVTNAIKQSGKGDIVMLEMQAAGPGGDFGPAEVTKSVWSATKTGTDAGVVVIGAAGNGNQNLDSSAYSGYRSWGDSGLIMVGAGSNNTKHSKLGFSTYGKRVDVQGWGTGVVTAGYGTFKRIGGDSHQSYSNSFNGTSSATPTVVGAALLIQSHAKKNLGAPYTPAELRKLLKATGEKQGGGGHIGPFPNVRKAIASVSEPEKNKPKVEITKPDGDIKGKTDPKANDENVFVTRIEVDASDDSRVKEVYLEVDGDKLGGADTEEPYAFDLKLEPGKYKIVAVAVDRYDNKASSESVTIRVSDGNSDESPGDAPDDDDEPDSSSGSVDSDGDDNDDSAGADSDENGNEPGDDDGGDDAGDAGDAGDDESPESSDTGNQDDNGKPRGGCKAQIAAPGGGALWLGVAFWSLLTLRRRG